MGEKLDAFFGETDWEYSWVDSLVANVSLLVEEFPKGYLTLEPFFSGQAIDVSRRAPAYSFVAYS